MKYGSFFTISNEGPEGNAFRIMAIVKSAMEIVGLTSDIKAYVEDATSKDYNHLWEVSKKQIDRCNKIAEKQSFQELLSSMQR